MPEVAITLPLDVVEQLTDLAAAGAGAASVEQLQAISCARQEIAQIKEMLDGRATAQE